MNDQASSRESLSRTNTANRLGFYAAILTSILTLVTFGIAFLTPPLSGPGCQGLCFEYPYTDIASRFPRDYYWMYPAMLVTFIYYVLVVCIHHYSPPEKKVYSHIGISVALIATAVLIVDYFIQVTVIQPSLVNGETEGIALITQFNSHGIFIALEEIGYFFMSVAFLFLAPVFSRPNRLEKAIRWIFTLGFILTVISLAIFSLRYGIFREYWFEIAAISINWGVLIVSGILLSLVFKQAMNKASYSKPA
jgi:hypothetical protein